MHHTNDAWLEFHPVSISSPPWETRLSRLQGSQDGKSRKISHLNLGSYETRWETRQHKVILIPTPIFDCPSINRQIGFGRKKKTSQTDHARQYLVIVTLVIVPSTYFSNWISRGKGEGGHKTGTASCPVSRLPLSNFPGWDGTLHMTQHSIFCFSPIEIRFNDNDHWWILFKLSADTTLSLHTHSWLAAVATRHSLFARSRHLWRHNTLSLHALLAHGSGGTTLSLLLALSVQQQHLWQQWWQSLSSLHSLSSAHKRQS